ncbi:anti-sigma F factor antagonist [Tepidibacter formicigenes]|uniref:Anti-sigma F factor antagonist n=1 Tax=Tepidibacter formicigenes DSM 15518 TaxID=1123349 RepID=A0A1M6NNY3_9FIRM|nr:anti-sigma F factor antagonist [Tepidibacter formicigenes]SHJ97461.1 anti-anti-sigma regulatory factor, SpoIIAA [Tepidibacter formicigenes DSM 15518]
MNINYKIEHRNLIVELYGELDHHIASEVREEIDMAIDQNSIKNVIFDFKNMNFMDSSGVGVVIGRYKKVSKTGGKVIAVNLNKHVKRIFELSGMNKIIEVYNNREEALSSL